MLQKNAAHLVVLLRTLLAFVAVILLGGASVPIRASGFVLLVVAAILDGVDGHLARRFGVATPVGARLDTLGDRITENLLFVFLALRGLVPAFVPIFFVTRSFVADFVRSLHANDGLDTFAMNESFLGRHLVASRWSRAAYLGLKFAVFLAGAAALVVNPAAGADPSWVGPWAFLADQTWNLSLAVVVFSAVRFILLLHDSRRILRREFGR